MDPIVSPIIGALILTWVAMRAPAAIADAYTAMKAAHDGQWDHLDRDRDRRDARSARRAAWAERIAGRRAAKAAGDRERRAGLGSLVGDVYHGVCEDALDRRGKRRAVRREAFDPTRPTLRERAEAKLRERVERHRQARDQAQPVPDPDPPSRVSDDLDVDEAADLFKDNLDEEGLALIRRRRCCWPVAVRPDGRFVYCADPTADGFIYCDPHLTESDRELDNPVSPAPNSEAGVQESNPIVSRTCPTCGETMTKTEAGWSHPGGPNCRVSGQPYRPSPKPRTDPIRTGTPTRPASPTFGRGHHDNQTPIDVARRTPEPRNTNLVPGEGFVEDGGTYFAKVQHLQGSDCGDRDCAVCAPRRGEPGFTDAWAWSDPDTRRCSRCGHAMARIRVFGDPPTGAEWMCALCRTPPGEGVPIPKKPQQTDNHQNDPSPIGGNPTTGGTMSAPTVEDVQTNEAARRAFQGMADGAQKLAEAADLAEQARAQIAASAQAAGDGMAGIKFDAGAVSAVADINDTVGTDTLTKWAEAADNIGAAAKAGIGSLEKYRDAEDTVATNNVDARTLEPSAS